MLETIAPQPADQILALMGEFRADSRQGKIDLGVGVYRDAQGVTPIMRAVAAAERRLLETETTKTYTALAGEAAFRDAMAALVLGPALDAGRTASLATVGGTGAVRQGLELARLAAPGGTVWVPEPTWPNHLTILAAMGLPVRRYPYYDEATGGVAVEAMLAALGAAQAGDVVVLHGCCHNPTGADLGPDDWQAVAELMSRTGAVPLVDLAYQGFGDGLDADAAGTRTLAAALPEVLVAASCSKNFGIYRERTGALLALAGDGRARDLAQGAMATLNRQAYSFPPDHGARIVSTVLGDPALAADWRAELDAVRGHMLGLRRQLAEELAALGAGARYAAIARQRGMFSRLPVSPEQVARLKREAAIYIVGDGRVNIAGLTAETVPVLARALVEIAG